MKLIRTDIVALTFILIATTNGQSYSEPNYSQYRTYTHELTENDIPQGAASLAFVFDITGSMYDDLVQVIEGAAKILATTLARVEQPLYNYVLVPFHDPEVGPVTVTKDSEEFQDRLRDLYVQGGGDCPEMSITAIQQALNVSLPNSYIYVFTDARSKDFYLTESVLTLIQQKQSQVVFVMTGDCGNTSHPGYKAYEQIASTSSGQVFLLKKSQVNEILNFVRVAVQSRKVNLLSTDRDQGDVQEFTLPIDSQLKEFTVSLSGDNPTVTLIDPKNRVIKSRRQGLRVLLNLKNVLIKSVKRPKPGLWRFRVSSSSLHTLRITGLSGLDFAHKFSKRPLSNFSMGYRRPIRGSGKLNDEWVDFDIPTHTLLNVTGLGRAGSMSQLTLMDLYGKELLQVPVERSTNKHFLYNATAFLPPTTFFYLKINGMDKQGYQFQRTTPTAISAIVPFRPEVFMPEVTVGHYDRASTIKCKVESLIPYQVQWYREGVEVGTLLYYSDDDVATYTIEQTGLHDEAIYMCNASSKAGWQAKSTFLDVTDPPPSISITEDTNTLPGHDAILNCVATSNVDFNMTWYRTDTGEELTNSDRFRIFNNGSLKIRNADSNDEGHYTCRASNVGGSSEADVFLRVGQAPVVTITPSEVNFVTGQTVTVTCSAVSFPPAQYIWTRSGYRIKSENGVLVLRNLVRANKGEYKCRAVNGAGDDSKAVRLTYTEPPILFEPEKTYLVEKGKTATLSCRAKGIPDPTITWYKGDLMIHDFPYMQVSEDGVLTVSSITQLDAGDFRCEVSNPAGTITGSRILEVGTPPRIIQAPIGGGIDILQDIKLSCGAVGYPTPKILWRREDGQPIQWRSKHFKQLPDGSLMIQQIQKEQAGWYVCSAQNQFGTVQKSAEVSVTGIVRPAISFTNPAIDVVFGDTAVLACNVVSGFPKPHITWYKDDEVLNIDANPYMQILPDNALEITNARPQDESRYTCHASNVGGQATFDITLNVQLPPSIADIDGKLDFVVNMGDSVRLPCEAIGEPRPIIQWTKNGAPIGLLDAHYIIKEEGSLEIFSADPADTATYICLASNVAGEERKEMTLFVQVRPEIAQGSDQYTSIVNETVILECAVNAIPEAEIKWFRDDKRVFTSGEGYLMIGSGNLIINKVAVKDMATWSCEATNVAGTATRTMSLIVQVPPTILSVMPDQIIKKRGEQVVLDCEAVGLPDPDISWQKGADFITVEHLIHGISVHPNGSLVIEAAELSDTGSYACIARNPAGQRQQVVALVIHEAPFFPSNTPKNNSVIESQSTVMLCPAKGTPGPIITWYKDGVLLTGNELGVKFLEDGSLQINKAQASDKGTYKCVATNDAGRGTNIIDLAIYLKPRFGGDGDECSDPLRCDVDLKKVTVNDSLTIDCPVTAHPLPEITWFKDNRPIDFTEEGGRLLVSERGKKLTITRAKLRDTGRYTCTAENVAGSTQKNTDVEVQEPADIDESKASKGNLTVIMDRPLTIDCPAVGTPLPEVTWFKDGRPIDIDAEANIEVQDNGRKLLITSAEVDDTGRYKCVATNEAGEQFKIFDISVHVPPSIEDSDEVATPEVILGESVDLLCPASGIPKPKIKWFKDDTPLRAPDRGPSRGDTPSWSLSFTDGDILSRISIMDGGERLRLVGAEVSDAARYVCRAISVAGEAEKYFDLSVLVPPYIDDDGVLTNPSVVVNKSITINCPAAGNPPPEIMWLKNGELLDVTDQAVDILADGRQLRIRSAQVTDTAQYRCLVSNKAGKTDLDFDLDVYVPSSIVITGIDTNPKVVVNNSVIIDCPATGIPIPRIVWMKNDRALDLQAMPNLRVLKLGLQLEIRNTQVSDTGIYTCRAINAAGDSEIDFSLDVLVPPTIDTSKLDQEPKVIVNRTIIIDCPAKGIPDPAITWLKNGQAMSFPSRRYRALFGGRQLEIRRAQVEDTARYTCMAKNEAGQDDADFDLTVWVPPYIDRTGLDTQPRVIKGRTLILNCPARGIPDPEITWVREREPIVSDNIEVLDGGLRLKITNVVEGDRARYTCIATNVAGRDTLDFDVTVLVPPSIDLSNSIANPRVVTNRTVIIECPVFGIPPPSVSWLRDGRPVVGSDQISIVSNGQFLEIAKAHPSDTGDYTCVAVNEAGELRKNFKLTVLVPPTIDDTGLQFNIDVIENNTITLHCPATGIPDPSMIWFQGYEPLFDFPYENMELSEDEMVLTLLDMQVFDEGEYTCQAHNRAGKTKRTFNVNVLVPPTIEGPSSTDMSVVQGKPITLNCPADGKPFPKIEWYKDGEIIDPEAFGPFSIVENGLGLEIKSATTDETARYTCRATNVAGRIDKLINLNVLVPPTIEDSEKLTELKVSLNKAISMDCIASGIPNPTITWFQDGTEITSISHPSIRILGQGRQLRILVAQLVDVGSYQCLASSPVGNATRDFSLTVLVPPTIEDGPTYVAKLVGESALLMCESLGLPDPVITWKKDDKPISSIGLHYRMRESGTLEFNQVRLGDTARYTCTASNEAGSVVRDVELFVQVRPTIVQGPETVRVTKGQTVRIPCNATGTPMPRISWQKGTSIISNSAGTHSVLPSGTLKITNSQVRDSGVYICLAQNSAGIALAKTKVVVQVPPAIEDGPSKFRVIEGSNVTMGCKSYGKPKPTVIWQKDGKDIPVNDNSFMMVANGAQLFIPLSRYDHTGTFTCIAKNHAGEATMDFSLTVEVPPVIEESRRVYTIVENENIALPCKARGIPTPTIQWVMNGSPVDELGDGFSMMEDGTLIVREVKSDQRGTYSCIAINRAGRATKDITLRVQVPPRFTVSPQGVEVTVGENINLECVAVGRPTPIITWKVNGTDIAAPHSNNGQSQLIIKKASKKDDGTYMCVAQNPAGVRRIIAAVVVKVPPKVVIPPGNHAVTLAERVILSCTITGDPQPRILWMKNGQPVQLSNRVQQIANGSLIIYDSSKFDQGEYKCVASNEAGTTEGVSYLTVKSAPDIIVEPVSRQVDLGDVVVMNCVAEGEPEPTIVWKKENTLLYNEGRISILPNNSLRILGAQKTDGGVYMCLATSAMGSVFVEAALSVRVNGRWGSWEPWSVCSASCGNGEQTRIRECNEPAPANGGRSCEGDSSETRRCMVGNCPVDGQWGSWLPWESCSTTCGQGEKLRTRQCDSPPPEHGGKSCDGERVERDICKLQSCAVDGEWGDWSPWQPCSVTCNDGMQERYRKCDSPAPREGGDICQGQERDRRRCNMGPCAIHGSWGPWDHWSMCSQSCGGGTRERARQCNRPAPSHGGLFCPGRASQTDYCNNEPCPVNGQWSEWSSWGECTVSCNGGKKKRFRTCSNPEPAHGGRACKGAALDVYSCNRKPCPEDGQWSEWGDWSRCSLSCDGGSQSRRRNCNRPRFGGKACAGDGTQIQKCNIQTCEEQTPKEATAQVIGNINGIGFGPTTLTARVTEGPDGTLIEAKLPNIPPSIGFNMRHLVSILSPVYWTTATEVGGAVNGYTLTKANFRREIQVEFATGEVLQMTHIARGMNKDGTLDMDIIVSGRVPILPPQVDIVVEPYTETYVQTGPGTIYSQSSRMFQVDGNNFPYAWNHTIKYDPSHGKMPYLVQKLESDRLKVDYDARTEELQYQVAATISKGVPSNQCPTGFFLDPSGPFCRDDDECARLNPCSHSCHNGKGSFYCSCPNGMSLDMDGRTCKDVDECDVGIARCHPSQDCLNTVGSYQCIARCGHGFKRTPDNQRCQDINECREQEGICQHRCHNLIGGYRCTCTRGFTLAGKTQCQDIDECRTSSPCSHQCTNTKGSYQCSCPNGYRLLNGGVCRDVDECTDGSHSCLPDQNCRNLPGSFECVRACREGFTKARNGSCVDVNECVTGDNRCHYNQQCINTYGGYSCSCPRGFTTAGVGQPCTDIDECLRRPCAQICRNLIGSFECLCQNGLKLLSDGRSCAGLQYLPTDQNSNSDPNYSPFRDSRLQRVRCAPGFARKNGQCIDVNECKQNSICQHNCENTRGSYRCSCPAGYRLAPNGRTCLDIDECKEQNIQCGADSICFNKKGDFECIHTPCPADYIRDPESRLCVLPCSKYNGPCPAGSKYADIVEFRVIALPSGIPAYQDLIRLIAYDQRHRMLDKTTFTIIENDPNTPFSIKDNGGKGIVYTLRPLTEKETYQIKVRAESYDDYRQNIMYKITFILHIAVSAFPF